MLWSKTLKVSQPHSKPQRFTIELPEPPDGGRILQMKTSHCFVPLNLGLTYDPRRLGVRVMELRFLAQGGNEVK